MEAAELINKVNEAIRVVSEVWEVKPGLDALFRYRNGRVPPATGIFGAVILWKYASKPLGDSEDVPRKLGGNFVLVSVPGDTWEGAVADVLGISVNTALRLEEGFQGYRKATCGSFYNTEEADTAYAVGLQIRQNLAEKNA